MQTIKEKPKTLIEFNGSALTIIQKSYSDRGCQEIGIIQIQNEDIPLFLDLINKELSGSK